MVRIWRKKDFFKDELPVCAFHYLNSEELVNHPKFGKREFWKLSVFGPGRFSFCCNGMKKDFDGTAVALSHPDELSVVTLAMGTPVTNILILSSFMQQIAPDLCDPQGFFRFLEPDAPASAYFPHGMILTPHLKRLLNDLLFELQHTDFNTVAMLKVQLTGILIEFCRGYHAEEARLRSRDRMKEVRAYLQTHFREKITAGALAKEFNISLPHLFARWKKETGKTIGESLTCLRLDHAVSLLQENGRASLSVARESGFSSPGSYYAAFKRRFGCTPAAYLKRALPSCHCSFKLKS